MKSKFYEIISYSLIQNKEVSIVYFCMGTNTTLYIHRLHDSIETPGSKFALAVLQNAKILGTFKKFKNSCQQGIGNCFLWLWRGFTCGLFRSLRGFVDFPKNSLKGRKHHLEKLFDIENDYIEKSIVIMDVVNPLNIET